MGVIIHDMLFYICLRKCTENTGKFIWICLHIYTFFCFYVDALRKALGNSDSPYVIHVFYREKHSKCYSLGLKASQKKHTQ